LITLEATKDIARALDIGKVEAKKILEEHKGYIDRVYKKFGITMTFEEFISTKRKDKIPFHLIDRDAQGYLYCNDRLYIEIVDENDNKYSLILGNTEYTHHDLSFLEEKLYQWALSEGY
jgi:hypothetical protein